jgi:hypothetical protein
LSQSKQKENISIEQNKDLDLEMNELTIVSDPDIESPSIAEEKGSNYNNENNIQNKSLSSPAKGEVVIAEVNISSPDLATEKSQSSTIDSKEDQIRRSPAISRPHHIPKMESLSKKMDELRKALGNEEGMSAPWDANGKPLKNNLQKHNLLKK